MLSFEPSLVKVCLFYQLNSRHDVFKPFVICVDDDIPHTRIFLTFSNPHFYVHFDHEHVPRFYKSLVGIMPYSIPFKVAPLYSYIGDLLH